MADIKKLLSDEMCRLARRELKAQITPLAKKLLELRKSVSEISKELKTLKSASARPAKAEILSADTPACDVKNARLSAGAIRKIREKLGLSQMVFGKLIDASLLSVSHWELGKTEPRDNFKARIIALKGVGKREAAKLLADKNIESVSGRKRKGKPAAKAQSADKPVAKKRGRKPRAQVVEEETPKVGKTEAVSETPQVN